MRFVTLLIGINLLHAVTNSLAGFSVPGSGDRTFRGFTSLQEHEADAVTQEPEKTALRALEGTTWLLFVRRVNDHNALWICRPNGKESTLLFDETEEWSMPSWGSSNKSFLALRKSKGGKQALCEVKWPKREVSVIAPVGSGFLRASYSPDMTKVIFSDGDKKHEIFIFSKSANTSEKVYTGVGAAADPAWSPDGSWIAYQSNNDRLDAREKGRVIEEQIWISSPDGSFAKRVTSKDDVHYSSPSWSPDSKRVAALAAARDSGVRACVELFNIATRESTLVIRGSEKEEVAPGPPAWSSDGRLLAIAFRNTHTNASRILIVSSSTGLVIQTLPSSDALDHSISWSH